MVTARECTQLYGYRFEGNPDVEVHPNVVRLMRENPFMEQRSPEWYEARNKVISASSIASILGQDYKDATCTLRDKVFGSEFKGNAATRHGTLHEPTALDRFIRETGHTVFEFGLLPHAKYKFASASPDGVCANNELVEIKTPLYRRIEHKIPKNYVGQVQMQMEVCDSPKCHFVQMEIAGIHDNGASPEKFDILTVDRDRGWWDDALPKIVAFWKDVLFYREHPYMLAPCTIVPDMYAAEAEDTPIPPPDFLEV
jgi:putative phage-type endonuclease